MSVVAVRNGFGRWSAANNAAAMTMLAVRDVAARDSRSNTVCSANCWPSAHGMRMATSRHNVGRACQVSKCHPTPTTAVAARAVKTAVSRKAGGKCADASPHSRVLIARASASVMTIAPAAIDVHRGAMGASTQV